MAGCEEVTELSDENDLSDSDQELWQPLDNISDSDSGSDLDLFNDTDSENVNIDPTPIAASFDTPSVSSIQTVLGKNKDTVWHLNPFGEARTPVKKVVRIPKNRTP